MDCFKPKIVGRRVLAGPRSESAGGCTSAIPLLRLSVLHTWENGEHMGKG